MLLLELVYEYADTETRMLLNKVTEHRLCSIDFMRTKAALLNATWATRTVHPDCLEIEFSSGERIFQDATTTNPPSCYTATGTYIPPPESAPTNHPVPCRHVILRAMYNLDPQDTYVHLIEDRFIPAYLNLLDEHIRWYKRYIVFLQEGHENEGYHDTSAIERTIEYYMNVRQLLCDRPR